MFGVEVRKGIHLGPVVHTSLKLRATGKPRDDMSGAGAMWSGDYLYWGRADKISQKLSDTSPSASISENFIPGAVRNHCIAGIVIV